MECNGEKVGESSQELPALKTAEGDAIKNLGICAKCFDTELTKRVENYKEANKHDIVRTLLTKKVDEKEGFFVSNEQLKAWKKGDPCDSVCLNNDIVCGCGTDRGLAPGPKRMRVVVSAEAWKELTTHFPEGAIELRGSRGVCELCEQKSIEAYLSLIHI